MASLKDLKKSITEVSEGERVHIIIESRQRRIRYKSMPDKSENKKIISKLSQSDKLIILEQLEKMGFTNEADS